MPNHNKKYMALGALVLLQTYSKFFKSTTNTIKNNEETVTVSKIEEQINAEDLFISNRAINNEEVPYSDFSSSPYRSTSRRELSEEDISEIITIVDESRNLSENTKKVIKLNSALLLLVQQRRR